MRMSKKDIGARGEEISTRFLSARGYKIIERNYRTPFGELDIIAKTDEALVFVEVKTLVTDKFGPPLSSVTPKKQQHILKSSSYYFNKTRDKTITCRIDLIGIYLDNNGNSRIIQHVKNALLFGERRFTC